MYELQTLGSFDLRAPGGASLTSVLSQPKRSALLCYLLLAGPGRFHRRDTLLSLFWPEHDEERARAALRQALYFLQGALGHGCLERRGKEEIGVDPACFRCDVVEFDAAVTAGRREDALALYRGPLLAGFHVADAPDFTNWLERERQRIDGAARQCAEQLFEAAEAAGDVAGARDWAERYLSLTPEDEDLAARLMLLLARAGDRAGALRAYERFAGRLRDEFDTEPMPELDALAATLRDAPRTTALASERLVALESAPTTRAPIVAPADASTSESPGPASPHGTARSHGRARTMRRGAILLVPVLLVVLLATLFRTDRGEVAGADRLDPALVAVLPFRVSAVDSVLTPLSEGMVDLLGVKFVGESGLRAVDPRTVAAALDAAGHGDGAAASRDESLAVARHLGAGLLLLGSVVQTEDGVALSATLLNAADGRVRGQASVDGPRDSLLNLVDRLAGHVLGVQAGVEQHRLASLTSTSLPAVHEYLAGRAEYRRGRFPESAEHFREALDLDSTFALAALALHYSLGWGPARFPPGLHARAERLAWTSRDRLGRRDRMRLLARVGARYPEWTPPSEHLAFLESAVADLPDDPELWYALGNLLFHTGGLLGVPYARHAAERALTRALELDPAFYNPQNHLRQLAIEAGDTAAVRHFAELTLAQAEVHAIRWILALVSGDTAASKAMRASRFRDFNGQDLARLSYESQSFGIAIEDGVLALDVLAERAASERHREGVHRLTRVSALNRGRPGLAALHMAAVIDDATDGPARAERMRETIFDALYWDGDSALAARSVAALEHRLEESARSDAQPRAERLRDACAVATWRMLHDERDDVRTHRRDRGDVRSHLDALGAARAGTIREPEARRARACAAMLDALIASADDSAHVHTAIATLDSALIAAVPSWMPEDAWLYAGIMTSVRLWSRHGQPARALASVRRRGEPGDAVILLAPFLREEGRLAALIGDSAAAIRAYRHYLLLRHDPEPALLPEIERVRDELRQLLAP